MDLRPEGHTDLGHVQGLPHYPRIREQPWQGEEAEPGHPCGGLLWTCTPEEVGDTSLWL